MRHDATPAHLGAGPAAVPAFLRELARVGEIDLAEGLGPQRLAALSRLAEQSRAAAARRRRRLACALVSITALVLAAAAVLLRLH